MSYQIELLFFILWVFNCVRNIELKQKDFGLPSVVDQDILRSIFKAEIKNKFFIEEVHYCRNKVKIHALTNDYP